MYIYSKRKGFQKKKKLPVSNERKKAAGRATERSGSPQQSKPKQQRKQENERIEMMGKGGPYHHQRTMKGCLQHRIKRLRRGDAIFVVEMKSVVAGTVHWQSAHFVALERGWGEGAATPPKANQEPKATRLRRHHKIDHQKLHTPCPINEGHPESDTVTKATGYLFWFAKVAPNSHLL